MPGSIHATYLVSGTRTKPDGSSMALDGQGDGEDEHMQSSPFMSSSMPIDSDTEIRILTTVVTLVGEEDLDGEKLALAMLRNCMVNQDAR